MLLIALNTATLRDVMSTTSSHLVVSLGESRFQFSHNCAPLLIKQLEATLDGLSTHSGAITKYDKSGNKVLWSRSWYKDYTRIPCDLVIYGMCAYEYMMMYKRVYTAFKKTSINRQKQNRNTGGFHKE